MNSKFTVSDKMINFNNNNNENSNIRVYLSQAQNVHQEIENLLEDLQKKKTERNLHVSHDFLDYLVMIEATFN